MVGIILTSDDIRLTLRRIVESSYGRSAPRCVQILRYVVEEELAGRGKLISSKTIAQDVFDIDLASEAESLSKVRVQAGRVRQMLNAFYENEGHKSPVKIIMPVGYYRPHFLPRQPYDEADVTTVETVDAPVLEAAAQKSRPFSGEIVLPVVGRISKKRFLAICAGMHAVVLFGLVGWLLS